jgi:CBS domain-containing protein
MQGEVVTVPPETPLPDLQRRFASERVGALPVVDAGGRILGLVSRYDVMRRFSLEQSLAELADSDFDQTLGVKDNDDSIATIAAVVGRRLAGMHARDVMIEEVVVIGPEATVSEAARIMTERRFHRLPVVEGGRLVGILSAFDFMRLYASTSA